MTLLEFDDRGLVLRGLARAPLPLLVERIEMLIGAQEPHLRMDALRLLESARHPEPGSGLIRWVFKTFPGQLNLPDQVVSRVVWINCAAPPVSGHSGHLLLHPDHRALWQATIQNVPARAGNFREGSG